MQYNFDTFLASAKTIKLYLMRNYIKIGATNLSYIIIINIIIIIIIIHTDVLNQQRSAQI